MTTRSKRKTTAMKTKQYSQKKFIQVKQKKKFVRDIWSCCCSALNMQHKNPREVSGFR